MGTSQTRIKIISNDLFCRSPHGHKKLKGFENRYRIRIGDYCVIYEVHDDVLLLIIVKVGSRRDIY
ncbi:MAG: type II toxin-antitoxin system RelE/ParE family toxin [Gammaproteobacteria bacterium]|nr:MAG: type II toxin-antitoxin system RelE/ParE family toxin [Gammaproteobacteria bacterium]RKZ75931.1 MAG: type II toxin-antitoxin system RelE/ParE family toxin [Gammaproteobacteria bacterium]